MARRISTILHLLHDFPCSFIKSNTREQQNLIPSGNPGQNTSQPASQPSQKANLGKGCIRRLLLPLSLTSPSLPLSSQRYLLRVAIHLIYKFPTLRDRTLFLYAGNLHEEIL